MTLVAVDGARFARKVLGIQCCCIGWFCIVLCSGISGVRIVFRMVWVTGIELFIARGVRSYELRAGYSEQASKGA